MHILNYDRYYQTEKYYSIHPFALEKTFYKKFSVIVYKNIYYNYLEEIKNRNIVLNYESYIYNEAPDYYDNEEFDKESLSIIEKYMLLLSLFYLTNYSRILKYDKKIERIVRNNIVYNYKKHAKRSHENFMYYYRQTLEDYYKPFIDDIIINEPNKRLSYNSFKNRFKEKKVTKKKFELAEEFTFHNELYESFYNYMISAGLTKYVWRTKRDDRVRPTHRVREGRTYDIFDSDIKPKQEIKCRCWGIPILRGETPPDETEIKRLQKQYFGEGKKYDIFDIDINPKQQIKCQCYRIPISRAQILYYKPENIRLQNKYFVI